MLSQTAVEQFRRDGYLVVPELLSKAEIARYAPAVRAAVAHRKRFDSRALAEKTAYEQSFIQCMNLWEDCPAVRPLTFHPKIAEAAAQLLGAPIIRLWHDQALFKEPGGRKTDLHQDLPYWTMAEPDALTAWIPLNGSTLQNGCMGYIAGSHALGMRRFVNIFRAGVEDLDAQAEPLRTGEPRYIEVPAGSVAFHHGLTAHDAKPNATDRTREVHTMIFFRDGVTRSSKGNHYAADRAGIQPGEPIRSDATPIAWPRADGDLPVPPTPLQGLTEAMQKSGAFPSDPHP